MTDMQTKRFLVKLNTVLSIVSKTLLLLFVSVFLFSPKRKRIRVPLAVNVLVITILLLIIAAYGGAFSKKSERHTAMTAVVDAAKRV